MKKKALVMLAACAMALALAGLAGCGGSGSASSASGSGSGSGGDNAASSEEQKVWYEVEDEDFAFYAEFPDGCEVRCDAKAVSDGTSTSDGFLIYLADSSKGPAKDLVERSQSPNQGATSSIALGNHTWYTNSPVYYATDLSDGRVVSIVVKGYDPDGPEVRTFLETFEVRGE